MTFAAMPQNSPALSLPPLVAAFLAQIADQPGTMAGTTPGTMESGAFSYAAAAVIPHTGWPADEFLPRLARNLAVPHNLAALEQARQRQDAGNFTPFIIKLACETAAAGADADFLVAPRPGKDREGAPCVIASIAPAPAALGMAKTPDLRAERTRMLGLLDVLPAYVMMIDQDHTVRFENRLSRQMFGQTEGRPCYQLLHGRSSPCLHCPPFAVFTANAIQVHEWASAKTNTAFRVHSYPFDDLDGRKVVLKIGINITAGVRAQHALDLSEQRYRSIADNLTLGIALLDPQLHAVTVNPRLVEWFGDAAMRGRPICDILHRQCCGESARTGSDNANCIFHRALLTKKNQEKEFSLLTAGAETRHFRLVACPILTRKKDVRALVMMLEDITDRHNLASRMQHIRRLEAMGTLAGGIAHEINQPLSALHLYASGLQMLLEQGDDVPPARVMERLSLILSQAEKIQHIISHMRALVMQEDISPPGAVSLREAVDGAMALVGTQLMVHNITVNVGIPHELPLVHANPVQLEQVLINLLINAMHALDTVERPEKTIDICMGVCEEETVRIRVVDNGPGVKGMEDRIFDPFYTTKEAHKGMGLGLSIVHAFVNAWGGDIRVRGNGSKPGASFTISLRTADESARVD